MRICIRFVVVDVPTGARRTFTLRADRPYPAVPHVGAAIVPDPNGQLAPRDVLRVVYEPDGTLTLDLDPGLPVDDPEAFVMLLESVGFVEEESRHLP